MRHHIALAFTCVVLMCAATAFILLLLTMGKWQLLPLGFKAIPIGAFPAGAYFLKFAVQDAFARGAGH